MSSFTNFFVGHVRMTLCMGFGSYDESEQESRDFEADFEEKEGVQTSENEHEGEVSFEFGASNDELLDRLQDIKNF